MSSDIKIRFAETDKDCIDTHLFLCLIAQKVLLCPIDADKSINEIIRVRDYGIFLMAEKNGHLIGTLGLTQEEFWYGKGNFLTDRWYFIYPEFKHMGVGTALLANAHIIAKQSGLDIVINGKLKKRETGIYFSIPSVLANSPNSSLALAK